MGSDRIWLRRAPVADMLSVLRSTGRILVRHWPVLLTIGLLGSGAQSFLLDAAIHCTQWNNVIGLLVFILVPISWMVALVLMLRAVRSSLPWLAGRTGGGRALGLVGSVLIPFLAVYEASGDLHNDLYNYVYSVWRVDPFDSSTGIPDRLNVLVAVIIVVAIGLRALLSRWNLAERHAGFGILAAYLEVIWITVAASLIAWSWDWLSDRRFVQWWLDGVHRIDRLGAPVHHVMDWLSTLIGSADVVIALPIAWLTIAAIVYGQQISTAPSTREVRLARAMARRTLRLPRIIRRAIDSLRDSLLDRFGPLLMALRVVVRAGLAPMLLFCLLFMIVHTAAVWLFVVERTMIGPHDLHTFWMPLSDPLSDLNNVVGTVLLSCLIGAVVDRVLATQPVAKPAAEASPVIEYAEVNEPVTSQIPAQRDASWDADTALVDLVDAVQASTGHAHTGDIPVAASLEPKTDVFGQSG